MSTKFFKPFTLSLRDEAVDTADCSLGGHDEDFGSSVSVSGRDDSGWFRLIPYFGGDLVIVRVLGRV